MSASLIQPCPCGSGLRLSRCCGLDLSRLGPPGANRHLVPIVERAMQAWRTGAKEMAEQLCIEVLELSP